MSLQLSGLPEIISSLTYGAIGLVAALTVLGKMSRGPDLSAFPSVGCSTWLGSWWAGFKYMVNAQAILQQGYEKHKSTPFKIAELSHWTVILSSRACLEDVARAPEYEFSSMEAVDDTGDTLGRETFDNPYHVEVVRSQLTRNIQHLYPEIKDEIVISFDELLDLRGSEWKSIPALSIVDRVVSRTSNRLFVGLPLCRNPEWIDLNLRYTFDVGKTGLIIRFLPKFVRPMAARFLSNVPGHIKHGVKLLGPVIEERLKYMTEYGSEWDDKPNDLLSWLMDEAEGPELTVERLTNRVLIVNFVAIHTTSHSFAQALFYLAAYPQYIHFLREEVEAVVKTDGWSKAALGKMRKVDSFLRECQRIEGLLMVTLLRKAMKDVTLSDGTFIPKGTFVAAPTLSVHHDGNIYEDPDMFDPFRFAKMREEDGMNHKYQLASTTTEYLPFGHGRHSCPGRFFAAYELKSMLAHTVLTYDVKLEDNATRPKSLRFATTFLVDHHAKIMFRRRVD